MYTLIFDWGDTIMRDHDLPGPAEHWSLIEWVPGAEDSLSLLSQEYRCVIATSAEHSGRSSMIRTLEKLGAAGFFEEYYAPRETGVSKPDPDFFRRVVEQEGADPRYCIAIGNSYANDIIPAKSAGCLTVFFNERGIEADHSAADAVIYSMQVLPNAISAITSG